MLSFILKTNSLSISRRWEDTNCKTCSKMSKEWGKKILFETFSKVELADEKTPFYFTTESDLKDFIELYLQIKRHRSISNSDDGIRFERFYKVVRTCRRRRVGREHGWALVWPSEAVDEAWSCATSPKQKKEHAFKFLNHSLNYNIAF